MEERLFPSYGARAYFLRFGLALAPALLTIFGATERDMILILAVGVVLSGAVQWALAHWGNGMYLSTTWTAGRTRLTTNRHAKNERERQRQLEERRREALRRAKREGEAMGIVYGLLGVGVGIYALVAM